MSNDSFDYEAAQEEVSEPGKYIVVVDGKIVEEIQTVGWENANRLRKVREGKMYIMCGGQ